MEAQGIPQGVPWPEGWPIPNYTNPPTRGFPPSFILTCALTTVVVALRLYSRCVLTRSQGIDDIFVLAGWVCSLGQTYASYKNLTTWGWNKHLWDVPLSDHEHVRLGAWLLEFFFIIGIGCTKISILFVYRRISSGSSSRWFIQLVWAAIAFTAAYILALTLYLLLICRPTESYWKSYSPTYTKHFTCGDERFPVLFSVVLNVVSDIYATVLPMILVRNLRISKKQRIGLTILFSIGTFTVCTGAVRIYYLNMVTINYKPGPHTHDITWQGWPLYAWTNIEASLAIICASAPALRVFFVKKLQAPLAQGWSASRSLMSRSRSRASSAKVVVHLPNSHSRPSNASKRHGMLRHERNGHLGIVHHPPPGQDAGHQRDVEKFPLEHIVRLDKSLPASPVPTWSSGPSPVGQRPGMPWSEGYANSVNSSVRDSSGEDLPIYLPGSVPPLVVRRI